jgi:hypothetical protein
MKLLRIVILTVLLLSLFSNVLSVRADDTPWGEILNPDGSIRWELLSDLGATTEAADWMDITLPGGMVIDLDATYHRYMTPSGNIVVLPSPATLFFMALHPTESGLSNADSMLGDGASILSLLIGPSLDSDQLSKLVSMGYTDTKDFFQAVINGQEEIWSVINVTFFFEVLRMSFDSGFMVHALLLYINDLASCAGIPGGCPEPPADLPKTVTCPTPSISQEQPSLEIKKVAPDSPLVIGQDPDKRGADIQASVTIPPVILTWYEEVQDPPTCETDNNGDGSGCPGPRSRYDNHWDPSMEDNPNYKVVKGDIHCIEHVEIVPEPITFIQANAQLNPESRYWILTDLASKYYEAYIHRDRFNLVPGMAPMEGNCSGNGVCSASVQIPNVPFADPGTFDLRMWVYTAGANFNWNGVNIPLTQPRVLFEKNDAQVYVTLVTLIPAGEP